MQYFTYIPPIRLDMLVAKFSRTLPRLVAKQFFIIPGEKPPNELRSQYVDFNIYVSGAFESSLKELQFYIQQCN